MRRANTGVFNRRKPKAARPAGAKSRRELGGEILFQDTAAGALTHRRLLVVLLAAGPLAWGMLFDHGIVWPDEIYQSLEPAHRFAFGYGLVAWEFQEGARSWLFPGVLGLLFRAGAWLGVESSRTLIGLARLPIAAFWLAGVYASMKLAMKARGGPGGELLAGVLIALFPVLIVFEHRALSETIAAPAVVIAALWTWDAAPRRVLVAGLLVGLASFARFQVGLVALGLLVTLVADGDRRSVSWYAAGIAVASAIGLALDWVTWGVPFASLYRYLEFNLFTGGAAKYGVEPFYFYFVAAWTASGSALIFVVYGWWAAVRGPSVRVRALLLVAFVFLAAHTLIGHKELRFLVPVIPLTLAIAGAGLGRVILRLKNGRRWVLIVAVYLAGLLAWETSALTFAELGQWKERAAGREQPFGFLASANVALLELGTKADLCGVAVVVPHGWGWTGGYTYLHRDVPMFFGSKPRDDQIAAANYIVRPVDDVYGPYEIVRLSSTCAAPPDDYTRSPPR